MLALVRRDSEFAGIIGEETATEVNGITVCIGDTVKVEAGDYYNESIGVVGIFTNRVSVMGLGSIPLSSLNVVEILQSHKELEIGSTLHQDYYTVRKFES